MSDILTRDEYAGIAAETPFPSNAWINGKYTAARSGVTFETVNPATGEVLAQVAACGQEDVDYAAKKARQAFESGVWSRLHPRERKDIMIKWVKRLKRQRHELAVLESLESGKPVSDCATIDLEETIDCLAWYAEAADKVYDRMFAIWRRCGGDDRARAGRGGGLCIAVELSDADDGVEGGSGPGGGE